MTLMITNQHFKLVRKYLGMFQVPSTYPGDKADLFQVGLIGVMKALKTHDETKSNINTWSWYWIRSEIRSEVNRLSKKIDHVEDQHVPHKDKVLIEQLLNMVQIPKDKEVLLRILSGQQTRDISKQWGVSRQCVEQRLARAHKDIRRRVNHERRVRTSRRLFRKNHAKDRLDRKVSC